MKESKDHIFDLGKNILTIMLSIGLGGYGLQHYLAQTNRLNKALEQKYLVAEAVVDYVGKSGSLLRSFDQENKLRVQQKIDRKELTSLAIENQRLLNTFFESEAKVTGSIALQFTGTTISNAFMQLRDLVHQTVDIVSKESLNNSALALQERAIQKWADEANGLAGVVLNLIQKEVKPARGSSAWLIALVTGSLFGTALGYLWGSSRLFGGSRKVKRVCVARR